MSDLKEEYLAHHGILGMKWGIRRFQPYSLIPRKSGKGGEEKGAAKAASKTDANSSSSGSSSGGTRKQKSASAKAAVEKKEKTARQRKEALQKIVDSGDPNAVYEHRHELTEKQLNDAISRINTEAKLAQIVRQQNPTKMDKVKQVAKDIGEINSLIRTGTDSYKNLKEVKDLYKKAQKDKKNAARNAESSEALNAIIKGGNRDVDIRDLQSSLTKEDLKTATERLKDLNEVEKSARKHEKQTADDREKNLRYLKKSMDDIESGKKTAEDWASEFGDVKLTDLSDDYFESKTKKKKKG